MAKLGGDLYREAMGLQVQVCCWEYLGDYNCAAALCQEARDLICLCGLSYAEVDYALLNSQIGIYEAKSEYAEAYDLHKQVLKSVPAEQAQYRYAFVLLNGINLQLALGTNHNTIQMEIDTIKSIFHCFNH
jgi:tetratricopeptide (TPR) repeat protein